MRALLEAIWADSLCRCPRHIVWWRSDGAGCQEGSGISWMKGTIWGRYQPRWRKPKCL
jgi:hypothetical protein